MEPSGNACVKHAHSVGSRCADSVRARLARFGAEVLTDRELVGLLLPSESESESESEPIERHEVADGLLEREAGLEGLARASFAALVSKPGVGDPGAVRLVAAFDLARRLAERPLRIGARIGGPVDVERHFLPRLDRRDQESFHVLLLDGRHRLLAESEVSVGTLTASLVHPREVFREAIETGAAALVLVHNHPSGDPSPSEEDRTVTRRLSEAGRLLGIEVVDHVIVARHGHFSFREAGEMPSDRATGRRRDRLAQSAD